jgi:hypothetical protein
MGGQEFETYTDVLREQFSLKGYPEFDPDLYRSIIKERAEFILPAVLQGSGQFPDSKPRIVDHGSVFPFGKVQAGEAVPELFSNSRRAYAVLNLSLAVQTVVALERIGLEQGVTVYTEGGFRKNEDYNILLASLVPKATFVLSGMSEATSFGAALVGWAAVEGKDLHDLAPRFALEQEPVREVELPGIAEYQKAFMEQLDSSD